MLSVLRKYITKEIKLGQGAQIFKFLCERCLDEVYVRKLLCDLRDGLTAYDFEIDDDVYFLGCLAFNWHLSDILDDAKYYRHPILTLILKCIVANPGINTMDINPIMFMEDVRCAEDANDPSMLHIFNWLVEEGGYEECLDYLEAVTDPMLTENDISKYVEELVDKTSEYTLYYVNIEYPSDDGGKNYEEFSEIMDIFGVEPITDTSFVQACLDFASGEGEMCMDLNGIELNSVLDLIKSISPDPLQYLSEYNNVFTVLGDYYEANTVNLINSIMYIKQSAKEVLF